MFCSLVSRFSDLTERNAFFVIIKRASSLTHSSRRFLFIRTIMFLLGGLSSYDGSAQDLDASINANWFEESDVFGLGGSLHFVFADYALEFVPGAVYYFTEKDSSSFWSYSMVGRLNIPMRGGIRPYLGIGTVRQRRHEEWKWLLNLSGGINVRLLGDRIVPFLEAAYRPEDDFNQWRFRSGLRLIFSEP